MSEHGTHTPDLDAIQAYTEAATEGPWAVDTNVPFDHSIVGIYSTGAKQYIVMVDEDDPTTEMDAAFIAAARTDVPALLAYARDLEARLGRVEAVHKPKSWTKYGIPCFDEFDSPTARINGCTCGNEHYPCPSIAALTATE